MGVDVDDRDKGFDRFLATLDVKGGETIGWHGDAQPYPDGESVVAVAAAHEFGTPTIPARSPLRTYYDSGGAKDLGDAAAKAMRQAPLGTGKAAMLDAVGKAGVDGVRKTIERGLQPSLSPATLANPDRDPRGIPLLDTGHLLEQVAAKEVER